MVIFVSTVILKHVLEPLNISIAFRYIALRKIELYIKIRDTIFFEAQIRIN